MSYSYSEIHLAFFKNDVVYECLITLKKYKETERIITMPWNMPEYKISVLWVLFGISASAQVLPSQICQDQLGFAVPPAGMMDCRWRPPGGSAELYEVGSWSKLILLTVWQFAGLVWPHLILCIFNAVPSDFCSYCFSPFVPMNDSIL